MGQFDFYPCNFMFQTDMLIYRQKLKILFSLFLNGLWAEIKNNFSSQHRLLVYILHYSHTLLTRQTSVTEFRACCPGT